MLKVVAVLSVLVRVSVAESELLKRHRVYQAMEVTGLENKNSSYAILDSRQTSSVVECSRRCAYSDDCLSFFYNIGSRNCQLHGDILNEANSQFTAIAGSRYYQLKRTRLVGESCVEPAECVMEHTTCSENNVCSCERDYELDPVTKMCHAGMVGHKCLPTDVCVVAFSECRSDGSCGCVAGYSFQRSSHTCRERCDKYGNTFQYFHQHAISGRDVFQKENITPEECQQLCVNATDYTCASIDVNFSTGTCYHQTVDASDVPGAYLVYLAYNYYQRDCA